MPNYFGNGERCYHHTICDKKDITEVSGVEVWTSDRKTRYTIGRSKLKIVSYSGTEAWV